MVKNKYKRFTFKRPDPHIGWTNLVQPYHFCQPKPTDAKPGINYADICVYKENPTICELSIQA